MPRYLDDGGWFPIDRNSVAHLPRDRAYSEVEAMVSLSADLDAGIERSERDYARMWRWSRGRVGRFLERVMGNSPAVGGNNVNAGNGPDELRYVAGLRRPTGHLVSDQERATNGPDESRGDADLQRPTGHERATSLHPHTPEEKKKSSRGRKPWHGLTRDLDALLACREFLLDLAKASPVLEQWSTAEVAAWARQMATKGRSQRKAAGRAPLVNFAQYLRHCARYAANRERPRLASASDQRGAGELAAAAASMAPR